MNILNVLQDLRDCVCAIQDALSNPDPESGLPYDAPQLDPGEMPTFIDYDPMAETAGGNKCQSAYALQDYTRFLLRDLADKLDFQSLGVDDVAQQMTGVGFAVTGVLLFAAGATVLATFSAVLAFYALAGYSAGRRLRELADNLPPELYICAFTESATATDAYNDVQDDIQSLENTWITIRTFLRYYITPENVLAFWEHKGFNELGEVVAFDLSSYPAECFCGELDTVWLDLQGTNPDLMIVDGCNGDRFGAWAQSTSNNTTGCGTPGTLPLSRRTVDGIRCHDGTGISNYSPPYKSSIWLYRDTTGNDHRQRFTVIDTGDYELYYDVRRLDASGHAQLKVHIHGPGLARVLVHQSGNTTTGPAGTKGTVLLENLAPGNYCLIFSATWTNLLMRVARLRRLD
jgi:hypothetical protein